MEASIPHPWEELALSDYEGHMSMQGIEQTQVLNALTQRRLLRHAPRTLMIWGIAGGNGLEHVDTSVTVQITGVDVNEKYLAACRERHARLGDMLTLLRADLSKPCNDLPCVDLLIADLFIEYIGIEAFIARVKECAPKTLCCVIQKNISEAFVSASPYMHAFAGIGTLHRDIEEGELVAALGEIGYGVVHREEVMLKNGKMFVGLEAQSE